MLNIPNDFEYKIELGEKSTTVPLKGRGYNKTRKERNEIYKRALNRQVNNDEMQK